MRSLTVGAGSTCLREHDSPRMRKTMPAICGIALALCVFSRALPAQTSAQAPTPSAKTVVFLGDSLTAGLGLPPSEAFPALIGEKIRAAGLPYQVENAGLSGDTSAGGLRRTGLAAATTDRCPRYRSRRQRRSARTAGEIDQSQPAGDHRQGESEESGGENRHRGDADSAEPGRGVRGEFHDRSSPRLRRKTTRP